MAGPITEIVDRSLVNFTSTPAKVVAAPGDFSSIVLFCNTANVSQNLFVRMFSANSNNPYMDALTHYDLKVPPGETRVLSISKDVEIWGLTDVTGPISVEITRTKGEPSAAIVLMQSILGGGIGGVTGDVVVTNFPSDYAKEAGNLASILAAMSAGGQKTQQVDGSGNTLGVTGHPVVVDPSGVVSPIQINSPTPTTTAIVAQNGNVAIPCSGYCSAFILMKGTYTGAAVKIQGQIGSTKLALPFQNIVSQVNYQANAATLTDNSAVVMVVNFSDIDTLNVLASSFSSGSLGVTVCLGQTPYISLLAQALAVQTDRFTANLATNNASLSTAVNGYSQVSVDIKGTYGTAVVKFLITMGSTNYNLSSISATDVYNAGGNISLADNSSNLFRMNIPATATLIVQLVSIVSGSIDIGVTASGDQYPVLLDSVAAVMGNTAGAAVITNTTGTIQQYMRGLVSIFADIWDSTNHWFSTVIRAATTGGYTPGKLIATGSTNATSVKTGATTLGFINCGNVNAAARYVKVYDKSGSPTVGTDVPKFTILVPGSTTGANATFDLPVQGMALANGFSLAITTGQADNDTGAVSAGDVVVNFGYK